MERDNLFVGQHVQRQMHLVAQCRQFVDVFKRVTFVFLCADGIEFTKFRRNVFDLRNGISHAKPHVRIRDAVFHNRDNVGRVGGVDNFQVGTSLFNLVEKIFHAQAVDDKNISRFKRFHIFGRELIIVQATGLRRRQIHDFHTVNAASNVYHVKIDRIKRRDDF